MLTIFAFVLFYITFPIEVYSLKKPHIIFAIADDFGWNDVGFHNPQMRTPYIDAAAHSGIIMNYSYVMPVCSPSRATFLTGYYPFKTGMQTVIGFFADWGVPLQFKLLPESLRELGYSTHIIGKWHLGSCNASYLPTKRGFDTFFGYLGGGESYHTHSYPLSANDSSNIYTTFPQVYDFWNQTESCVDYNGTYSSVPFTTQVQNTLENRDPNVPLFLYMAFQNTHSPVQVDDQDFLWYPREKNPYRKGFSALATELDTQFGQLINMLKDYGIYDDSVIIFTADNGGEVMTGGNNYPLRGGKASLYEGGTRATAFIHSPKLKRTGFTYNGLIHAVDWYPTIVSLAGGDPDSKMDGKNLWPQITKNRKSLREEFVYSLNMVNETLTGAIRDGKWKLLFGNPGYPDYIIMPDDVGGSLYNTAGGVLRYELDPPPFQLYNIDEDPSESNDLASAHNDIVKKIYKKAQNHQKKLVKDLERPNNLQQYIKHATDLKILDYNWCQAIETVTPLY